jgi:hypothetical protein
MIIIIAILIASYVGTTIYSLIEDRKDNIYYKKFLKELDYSKELERRLNDEKNSKKNTN